MTKKKGKEEKDKKKNEDTKELKSQLARALADYDNLRKRVEREQEGMRVFASLGLIKKLLPVLDMLEEAQSHLQDSGLAITINEFKNVLEQEGIEKIPAEKEDKFNQDLHEAVDSEDEKPKGEIAEVILPGWKTKEGRVIRHTKVKVK